MNWVLFQSDWKEWSAILSQSFPNQTWPDTPPAQGARQAFLKDTARRHDLTLLEFIETIEDIAFRPTACDATKSVAPLSVQASDVTHRIIASSSEVEMTL